MEVVIIYCCDVSVWLCIVSSHCNMVNHDDFMTWKDFPYHWPFVMGIHQSLVDSHYKEDSNEEL